jgi:hypothetical protein
MLRADTGASLGSSLPRKSTGRLVFVEILFAHNMHLRIAERNDKSYRWVVASPVKLLGTGGNLDA